MIARTGLRAAMDWPDSVRTGIRRCRSHWRRAFSALLLTFFFPAAAWAQAEQCKSWFAALSNGALYYSFAGKGSTQLGAANDAIEQLNAILHSSTQTFGPCVDVQRTAWGPQITDDGSGTYNVEAYVWPGGSQCIRDPNWATGLLITFWRAPCPLEIKLEGGSATHALPAGPVLDMVATVLEGGTPVPNKPVSISVGGAGSVTLSGVTNANGQFPFKYVPPYQKATLDRVMATCADCSNTATKDVEVERCEVCEGKKGNPISLATGEKEQDEVDWEDASPHPLTLTRHYRSYGMPANAKLGTHWSHPWSVEVRRATGRITLKFGTGEAVIFGQTASGGWKPESGKDELAEVGGGALLYQRARDESVWAIDAANRLSTITGRNRWVTTLVYDASGRIATVTNAFGRSLAMAYDAQGQLATVTTPDGAIVRYAYDAAARLVSVTYPDGRSRSYAYEDARWPNALTGITDEGGARFATFEYDAYGRGIATRHAQNAQSFNLSYDRPALGYGSVVLASNVPPDAYRGMGQALDPVGSTQTYVFQGGDGKLRTVSASGPFDAGDKASRGFVPDSLLPGVETDFVGVQTTYAWDLSRELRTRTTRADGLPQAQTTETQWHHAFRLPILVTEAGRVTAYTYDERGNRLRETVTDTASGGSRSTAWTYNVQGLVDTMTDAKGGTWQFTYDAAGNRTGVTDPLGRRSTFTYDSAGRVLSQADPGGLVTAYTYDARGRVLTQAVGAEVTAYSYTPSGLLATAQLPSGYVVSYAYDAAQRLVGITDNRGASVSYTLDAAGNRIREEVRDGAGALALVTSRLVNGLNRIAGVQGAAGQTTQIAYDANGAPIAQTDPLNQTTRQTIDPLGRVSSVAFPDGASMAQGWNALDQLTRVTDPKGVATSYTYNAFGEVTSETSPDIGTVRYTRDGAGEVTQMQDAKGQIRQIERDALGRILHITYATDLQVHFTYDAAGYVATVDDGSGTTRYTRDAQGRVLTKTQAVNDNPGAPSRFALAYTYVGGQLSSVTYPSGMRVVYQRTAGRITGIDVQRPRQSLAPFVSGLAHTPLGQPKSWTWSNGQAASRTFDADGRMTGTEFSSYVYDAAGRITSITQKLWAERRSSTGALELFQAPVTWMAGYDSRDRLTSFDRDGASTHYTYDANSNRLTSTETVRRSSDFESELAGSDRERVTSRLLEVDATSNRLLGVEQTRTSTSANGEQSIAVTPITYQVDANGSLTGDGIRTFEYDSSGRLSRVRIVRSGEGASVRYLHNAFGQRVFKSNPEWDQQVPNEQALGRDFVNWLRKQFAWIFANTGRTSLGEASVYGDGELPAWALVGSYDNGTSQGRGRYEYIWLPTEDGGAIPVGLFANDALYSVQSDHLGTPRVVANASAVPVWQWPYTAFGGNQPTGVLVSGSDGQLRGSASRLAIDLRLPGQQFDQETGLAYNFMRTYDARVRGGYIQADPLGLEAGQNRFSYALGSPLRFSDPRGLFVGIADLVIGGGVLIVGCALNATCSSAIRDAALKAVNTIDDMCKSKDDDDHCDIVLDKGQLKAAGLRGREHEVKADELGSNKNLSKFDLCGCKDGRVVVKAHGCKGPIISVTDYRWK